MDRLITITVFGVNIVKGMGVYCTMNEDPHIISHLMANEVWHHLRHVTFVMLMTVLDLTIF